MNNPGDNFVWSWQRKTISRILVPESDNCLRVEIDVINKWDLIKEAKIRYNRFTNAVGDKFYGEITSSLSGLIKTALGKEYFEFLLNTNIASEICQDKLKYISDKWHGSSAYPFILICKDPSKYSFLLNIWIENGKVDLKRIHKSDTPLFNEVIQFWNGDKR